jgi:DNA-3-methyladenine glycosylase II
MKPDYWDRAKRSLARRDPVMGAIIRAHPKVFMVRRGEAFMTLARAICGQQISVKAAQAIWGRFVLACGKVTPANVVALAPEKLRACGFSGQKSAYILDLAMRFHTGLVKPRRFARMDDEAIIEELVQVKGIGRWSVEMFLIFHMMRPDVLPVDDLGLRRAMEKQYNDGQPLAKDEMRRIGEPWKPYASVGTWYLWRSLDPVSF